MKYFTKTCLLLAVLFTSATALAQYNVTGTVKSESGEPLIGVSIIVKGSTTGTVTDFNGNFTINVKPDPAILEFSYTGFKSKETEVSAAKNSLNITLEEDVDGIGNTFSGFMQKISAMQRVNFEDRDFEKRFEVYARDGDAARDVLGPKMRQTFCALDEMFSRKGVQAAFDEHKFFLAAKTKRGLTDPITVFKAMDAPRDVAATLADRLTLVHRVIDHLHGHDSVSGGRPGAP